MVTETLRLPQVKIKKVALPLEHGGWGFLFEPVVAGIAIAYSGAAPWICLLVIGAFLCRQPLKVLIIDRIGMRHHERAVKAALFLAVYGLVFAAGLFGSLKTAPPAAFIPFVLVLPVVAYQLFADIRQQSRALFAELSGAVTMSASIAAITIAAGWPISVAAAFWALLAGRLLGTVLYVRQRLLLEKGKPYTRTPALIAHTAALFLSIALAAAGLTPYLPILAFAVLFYRSTSGLSPNRTPLKAKTIGIREIFYGAFLVTTVIIGHYIR